MRMGKPIVLDIGAHASKVGFSDCRKNEPDIIFHSEELHQSTERDASTGGTSNHTFQDHLEVIASHALQSKLKARSCDHPLLMLEKPGLDRESRKKMVELAFEGLNVPAFHLASEPLMALYSVGLSSGIVLASGHSSSYVSTVHEGHRPPYGLLDIGFGGSEATRTAKALVDSELGKDISLTEAEEIKCKYGRLHSRDSGQCSSGGGDDLGKIGRKIGEKLISPGKDFYGFPEAVTRCIYLTDEEDDYEPVYFRNVVLCGGNTLFPGIKERLELEIKPPDYLDCGVRVVAPPFRQHAGWIGGSILAALPTFKPFWITSDDYSEFGKDILYRKCLPY